MVEPHLVDTVTRPDGCSIAMRVYNPDATRAFVLSNGLGCGDPMWRYVLAEFAKDHRVVTWDYRGQGDSSNAEGPGAYSAKALAADLDAVQQAAGVSQAVHVGFGLGALVALEHHRWQRDAVEALVLIQGGVTGGAQNVSWAATLARQAYAHAAPLAPLVGRLTTHPLGARSLGLFHGLATRARIVGRTCSLEDFEGVMASLAEQQEANLFALSRGVRGQDLADELGDVKVPTLVFAADKDPLAPFSLMQSIHERLHNSELERLPGSSHTPLLDLGPFIAARMRRFIEERRRQRPWKEETE